MQRYKVPQFLPRILGLFLRLGIALPLALGQSDPVFALRQAGLEENSARQDFLNRISLSQGTPILSAGGLEEPPYGRWLRADRDAKRVRQIVEQFKARPYPSARKKGPREHGTKKTLIALKKEGYYVRFYELDERDYFVFFWDQPEKRPLILWVQGQQVGDSGGFHLETDEVDYSALERELGPRLWRIYSGSHPYDRLKHLQVWLGQMPLAGAVALATAKDFEAAKKAYDDYIAGGVPVVAAYALATAGDRAAAKKAYDDYIAGGVPVEAAYRLATAGDRAAAKKAYDELIAQGVGVSEAYTRAVSNHSAGLEEGIPLAPGLTTKKVIFITPEMASPQLFESLKTFKPAPGEQFPLVVFAEHDFHVKEIQGWLNQAGLRALEVVNVKRQLEEHEDWNLFDVVAAKQVEYYLGTGADIHTLWSFEDLRNLGRFLGVAPIHVQLWEKSLERQFGTQA